VPLLGLVLVAVEGCAAEPELFGVGLDVEGVYAFEVVADAASDEVGEGVERAWYVMEDDGWVLFFGPYGTFLTRLEADGYLHGEEFVGSMFTSSFEGLYRDGAIGGRLSRHSRSGGGDVLEIGGVQEAWAEPTSTAPSVEGFYALTAEIVEQDCVSLGSQFSVFPSPFEFPALVFQQGNVLLFSGHGIRFQATMRGDGSFETQNQWESRRGSFDMSVTGAFDGTSLELVFETSNDVFNNGVVDCGSVFELSGRRLAPWYDEEHLFDVLSATRMVYFTPLDFVLFH